MHNRHTSKLLIKPSSKHFSREQKFLLCYVSPTVEWKTLPHQKTEQVDAWNTRIPENCYHTVGYRKKVILPEVLSQLDWMITVSSFQSDNSILCTGKRSHFTAAWEMQVVLCLVLFLFFKILYDLLSVKKDFYYGQVTIFKWLLNATGFILYEKTFHFHMKNTCVTLLLCTEHHFLY